MKNIKTALILAILISIFIGCENDSPKYDLNVIPESRKYEVYHYIHTAEDRLGMELQSDLIWIYKDCEGNYVRNQPVIYYPGIGWVRGYTVIHRQDKTLRTEVAVDSTGNLDEWVGIHEAARGILKSNGIIGAENEDPIMKEHDVW